MPPPPLRPPSGLAARIPAANTVNTLANIRKTVCIEPDWISNPFGCVTTNLPVKLTLDRAKFTENITDVKHINGRLKCYGKR